MPSTIGIGVFRCLSLAARSPGIPGRPGSRSRHRRGIGPHCFAQERSTLDFRLATLRAVPETEQSTLLRLLRASHHGVQCGRSCPVAKRARESSPLNHTCPQARLPALPALNHPRPRTPGRGSDAVCRQFAHIHPLSHSVNFANDHVLITRSAVAQPRRAVMMP